MRKNEAGNRAAIQIAKYSARAAAVVSFFYTY
jgi:hypothetical protein